MSRHDISALAARLQQLSGPAFERALEAALHKTWGDGWFERDKPDPAPNPYNILTRVPEDFLKLATEVATARSEFLEQNLNEHLFPELFKPKVQTEPSAERGFDQLFERDVAQGSERFERMAPVDLLWPTPGSPQKDEGDLVYIIEKRRVDTAACACPTDWFFDQPALSQLPHGHELPGSERTEVAHHQSCPKYFDDGHGEPDGCIRRFCGICFKSYEHCDCAVRGRR